MFFAEGGKLKACLVDRDQNLVAFVSADGWQLLLEAIEEGLQDGRLDWRAKKEWKPAAPDKKKS